MFSTPLLLIQGILLWKDGHGICNICNDVSALVHMKVKQALTRLHKPNADLEKLSKKILAYKSLSVLLCFIKFWFQTSTQEMHIQVLLFLKVVPQPFFAEEYIPLSECAYMWPRPAIKIMREDAMLLN